MLIQLAGKKKQDLDKSKEFNASVNSYKIAFFSFWFNLFNFCFCGVGVIINAKKADDSNIDIADADKSSKSRTDQEKSDGTELDRANKPNTSTADLAEAVIRDNLGISIADPAKADRADKAM